MVRRVQKKIRPYLYLVPVIFLFALGILFRSAITAESNACGCDPTKVTGEIKVSDTSANFEGLPVSVPEDVLADNDEATNVLGVASPSERWIEVDLSDQKLRAWDGNTLFLETSISSGLPGTPTPQGEFHIWMKIRATKMEGGQGRYYYYLPNVPYVMFFSNDKVDPYKGYGLHGTYWHNDFGNRRSHGCVNLPTPVAKALYEWTTPTLEAGERMLRASADNPGTRIVIHE